MAGGVGIGPTKTLSKVANRLAKRSLKLEGVCGLFTPEEINSALSEYPVENVWGISRQTALLLGRNGITTADQFRQMPDGWIRANMHVVGLRIAWELRGIKCHELELNIQAKKSIFVSRCFADRLTSLDKIREALLSHIARAGEKRRNNKQIAKRIVVFLHTSPHAKDAPFYYGKQPITLPMPTNNTLELGRYAMMAMDRIFKQGHRYMNCGIEMTELTEQGAENLILFGHADLARNQALMTAMDKLNQKMGRGTVCFAGSGLKKDWYTKRDLYSPKYTTDLKDLLAAYAGQKTSEELQCVSFTGEN